MTATAYALDFDGVLCDSVDETAAAAWRAGQTIWPHWRGAEPPDDWVAAFRAARPWLETGYEALLLLRLIDRDGPAAAPGPAFAAASRRLLADERLEVADLVARFGHARDVWMAADRAGWLRRNRFYPGTLERLCATLATGADVAILTTKQERFVQALLDSRGIPLPRERIFGLDRGLRKEALLERLLSGGGALCFVEDRLATLRRVAALPALSRVALRLAAWGYCTPDDLAAAADDPRIAVWQLGDFLASGH